MDVQMISQEMNVSENPVPNRTLNNWADYLGYSCTRRGVVPRIAAVSVWLSTGPENGDEWGRRRRKKKDGPVELCSTFPSTPFGKVVWYICVGSCEMRNGRPSIPGIPLPSKVRQPCRCHGHRTFLALSSGGDEFP